MVNPKRLIGRFGDFLITSFHREGYFLLGLLLVACLWVYGTPQLKAEVEDLEKFLPEPQVHSLPATLSQWQDSQQSGDYFDQMKPTRVGYLIWSEFPIKVYLDRPPNPDDPAASTRRFQEWVKAVTQAIAEWNPYLPMVKVARRDLADIVFERTDPPLDTTFDPKTGQLQIPRARSAQTRYEFYIREGNPSILWHRMTIQVSPRLSQLSLLSATRHELGHGLGIWGHSLDQNDVLYFSQVRNLPEISVRDINTLKKVYEQPTRLGWPLP